MKEVIAGIIQKDNKIFIARRTFPEDVRGKWEFPGGKIEGQETPQECLIREIFEELQMKVRIHDHFLTVRHEYPHGIVSLASYWAEWLEGEPILSDHDKYAWVALGELDRYEFAPADIPIVEKLMATAL